MQTLRVSNETNVQKLAGAIYRSMKENNYEVNLHAIGAGAVNQALKGVAVARRLAAPEGGDLKVVPGFIDVRVSGREVTGLNLAVKWR